MHTVAPPGQAAAARPAPAPKRRKQVSHRGFILSFLIPFGVLFVAMYLAPIAYSIVESLYTVKRSGLGLGPSETVFAGLDNYARVFADDSFLTSVGRVLLFGAVQVPVMLGLATVLALLLDSAVVRFPNFFRVAYFVPFALPVVVSALLWSFLYAPGSSPYQKLFALVGLSIDFTADGTVLWSLANIVTWAWTGYNMLIIYSALQALPTDIYEAAKIDGASGWQIAWRIKLPLVRPAITLTAVMSVIGTLQLYNEPAIVKHIAPAIDSKYTPLMLAQTAGLENSDYNFAAAVSVVLALATFALSFVILRFARRKGNL
ncbi:carbohydrate ABC transporter permease [Actinokineospora sp. HUAS TT18]|uniref:carbohydrate ABC transporter permease n=1 Tax=Actinokineospora sp. HUAS TT18 TaxID=3447451 RepID=UPI003F51AE67